MLSHLLKLMWKKRRDNGLIFLEIVLAFVVLFGVFTFVYYNLSRFASPLGFSYENSLMVKIDLPDGMDSTAVVQAHQRIRNEVLTIPGVAETSWLGPVSPFGEESYATGNDDYGFMIFSYLLFADENFAKTAELTFREGRWYNETDKNGKYRPVVLNGAFVDEYFPNAVTMIDSILPLNGNDQKVVGVIDEFKFESNFADREPLTLMSHAELSYTEQPFEKLMVRALPGRTAAVEEPLYQLLVDETQNMDVVISSMARDRIKANRPTLVPLIILTLISAFLLINIALGLFGVLFTQINRRRAEIGLRKAMGATPGEVTAQFVGEVLIVTVAGLLLGTFFAVQVPLLELLPIPGKFFYFGIVAAIATILVIVTLCALIPSRQAAGLHPATVLHED